MVYLVSISALSVINVNKFLKLLFIFLIPLNLILVLPTGFFQKPYLPGEISYTDYKEAFTFIANECNGLPLYSLINYPFISNFYGIQTNYVSYIKVQLLFSDPAFTINNEGVAETVYGNIPVLINPNWLQNLPEHSCLITSPVYSDVTRNITLQDFNNLNIYF